jgi:hypothetical protein
MDELDLFVEVVLIAFSCMLLVLEPLDLVNFVRVSYRALWRRAASKMKVIKTT